MEEHKNQMHLIVQYYHCAIPERQTEIDTCLRNNLLNPYLAAIHLLTEEQFDFSSFHNREKIVQMVVGERLTYERAFRYANDADPKGEDVWILSNADIYFDDTLHLIEWSNLDGVIYALTRYDVQVDGSIKFMDEQYAHGSQDVWIFRSTVEMTERCVGFRLGIPGCDNRIAYELMQNGYLVVNPSKNIICHHLDLTREADIAMRTEDYMKLHTAENISNGTAAPPPYQFYIFPTSELDLGKVDFLREVQRQLLALTDAYARLNDCARHIVEQDQLLTGKDQLLAEKDQLLAEKDILISETVRCNYELQNSLSWKVTSPIRQLLNSLRKNTEHVPTTQQLVDSTSVTFTPKVSIIIPVYNGANFLRQAIDSALSQTYRNLEIIVINDGSRDEGRTESIALSYGDKIRYVRKENGGVASALNLGIKIMTGDYFSWLSHDDIYFPNKIETQINYLEKSGVRDVVLFSNWEHIDDNGNSLGNRVIDMTEICSNIYAVLNCTINGCTLLIPRVCFNDVGNFDELLPTTQDYDLWFRMARKYRFIHVPRILVRYRIHPGQDSLKHNDHLREQNELHTKFNVLLTDAEILLTEKSVPIYYIKRAIFYKNRFSQAEQYTFNQFKKSLHREKLVNMPENLMLLAKYKYM